jgi:hypothetical protein
MDAKRDRLQKELEDLLARTSAVAARLQAIEQGPGTPHYDQIELPAHRLGQRFSRMIQSERAREVAASGLQDAPCPDCGLKCPVQTNKREVHSMDGPLKIVETVAECRRCRRSFFPSACRVGIRRA